MISNLNSIASLISLYHVNVTYSQLLGIRTQTSLGDHFSACGINFLKLITKIYFQVLKMFFYFFLFQFSQPITDKPYWFCSEILLASISFLYHFPPFHYCYTQNLAITSQWDSLPLACFLQSTFYTITARTFFSWDSSSHSAQPMTLRYLKTCCKCPSLPEEF